MSPLDTWSPERISERKRCKDSSWDQGAVFAYTLGTKGVEHGVRSVSGGECEFSGRGENCQEGGTAHW